MEQQLSFLQQNTEKTVAWKPRTFKKVHCLFEQSGTFKNEFISLGITAEDYDIRNDYKQTDHIIDLFSEIEKAYVDQQSVFDNFGKDDLILAFFPCTRFSAQILLTFWQEGAQHKHLPIITKLERDIQLQDELTQYFKLITKLAIVAYRRGYQMVIENPYGKQHYLTTHWCLKPAVIDFDRRDRGDKLKKPTQYFFINIEPMRNYVSTPPLYENETTNISGLTQTQRSEISKEYANRFIREYLI